jgi:hypothetical protein
VNLFLRSVTTNEAASPAEQTALLARSFAFKAILAEQTAVGPDAASSAPQTPDLASSITGQTHLFHKFIPMSKTY